MKKTVILLVCFLCVVSFCAHAQIETLSDVSKLTATDYENINIPPLNVLLDNAKNNPAVKAVDQRVETERSYLKTVRRDWLDFFKISGNYQYGISNYMTTVSDITMPIYNQYGDRAQSSYGIGATLSIPLTGILDRKNKISHQKSKIKEIEIESLNVFDELSIQIINAYTSSLQYLSILKSASESAAIATAQYKVTEKEFIQGHIDALALSRQKNIQTQALREYEQTRASLNNTLLVLELLSKTKIINR